MMSHLALAATQLTLIYTLIFEMVSKSCFWCFHPSTVTSPGVRAQEETSLALLLCAWSAAPCCVLRVTAVRWRWTVKMWEHAPLTPSPAGQGSDSSSGNMPGFLSWTTQTFFLTETKTTDNCVTTTNSVCLCVCAGSERVRCCLSQVKQRAASILHRSLMITARLTKA